MSTIGRRAYAEMFGPTTGDRVRLGDTELVIEVEADRAIPGEEVKFGGGKVIRDGMGQSQLASAGTVDTVITNALVLDHWGIVKADVGIEDGRIARIGKAGNPDTQPGVDVVIGPAPKPLRGRAHPHRRGDRRAHPLHLPPAGRGRPDVGGHHHAGRRDRPGGGHQRHHLQPPAPGTSNACWRRRRPCR